MDILSEVKSSKLEHIEHQYREGDITQEQAVAWLLQAIEREIQKHDAEIDDAWIDACEQLMDRIEQPQDWPDHRQENWAVIQAGMRKARRDTRIRQAVRVACVAACLVLMLVGVSYSRQWFQGRDLATAGAQQRTNAAEQLHHAEGLGHIIVSASIQPTHDVKLFVLGGEEKNGCCDALITPFLTQRYAIAIGEGDIHVNVNENLSQVLTNI